MKLLPLFIFTFALHLSLLASPFAPVPATELVVYSSVTSQAPLHVETISTNPTDRISRCDFPASYSGHRAVCRLPGLASTEDFKAWIGGSSYNPGDPVGVKLGDDNVIELADTHPIFARVPFAYRKGMSDREIAFGGTYTTSGTNSQGKMIMNYGSSDVEPNPWYAGDYASLLDTQLTRIRVIRTRIDAQQATQATLGTSESKLIYDKYVPTATRSFLCEYDVIRDGEYDIDWSDLPSIIQNDPTVRGQRLSVTQVVYRVCYGEGDFPINNVSLTNGLPWVEVSRRFGKNRVLPSALSVDTSGLRPVFLWRMDEGQNPKYNDTYTAFRLTVSGAASFDSGMKFRPPRDKYGRFRYTCPQSLPSGNYSWSVSMYNAKFQTNAWSTATITIP